jgi:hypothetical protein
MAQKKFPVYLVSVLLFMLLLPLGSILFGVVVNKQPFGWLLIGKWFIFWALGVRLFIAGVRQVSKPAFTAKEIFRIDDPGSLPVIRELGFANLCIGLIGILSLFLPSFRTPSAVAAGLYFGLAGFLHLFKKPDSRNELIALISDLFIFGLVALYLLFTKMPF